MAVIARDVGPHEGKRDSQRKQSRVHVDPYAGPGVFRSDGSSRFGCSTDLLTLVSESTGSHAPVVGADSADPVKVSESWNHSDMCRDCVH